MAEAIDLPSLDELARDIGSILRDRRESVAVTESSAGGLVSASLLSVPGASAFFVGGAVVYTKRARLSLLGISDDHMSGLRAETEPYARLIARQVARNLGATWGISESGAAAQRGRVVAHMETPPGTCAWPLSGRHLPLRRYKRSSKAALRIWSFLLDIFFRCLL